jgi:hypothetical protein
MAGVALVAACTDKTREFRMDAVFERPHFFNLNGNTVMA